MSEAKSDSTVLLDRLKLPAGFIVHVNGVPLKLESDTYVLGYKQSIVIADLVKDGKEPI